MNSVSDLVDCAEEVHTELGPGHSESTYHSSLEIECSSRGIPFTSEAVIPIFYKGDTAGWYRPDMFVQTDDGRVVVELKAGSKRGEDQLSQYQSVIENDNNYDLHGGVLIKFNDDLVVVRNT
jgi:GxxExxY protein